MSVVTDGKFVISKTYETRLINNRRFETGDIQISEYNIEEIFNMKEKTLGKYNTVCYYYPKRIFYYLLPHMTEIIHDDPGVKSIFCFGLHQRRPYQNPHNLQTMGKDIEVKVDYFAPTFKHETTMNKIENIIDSMEDDCVCFSEYLQEGVKLTVAKIEMLKREEPTNDEKTFKEESCVICLEKEPKVLFCNCGHLCICEKCIEINRLNKCPVCKTEITILRIIE